MFRRPTGSPVVPVTVDWQSVRPAPYGELRKMDCNNWKREKLAQVALPVKRGNFAFDVPSQGWYVMTLDSGKSGFFLYTSEVPVWMSLNKKIPFSPDAPCIVLHEIK